MLTPAEDVEAHALRKRGWTITAIANHLGKDRKTIRAYLSGQRTPGERAPAPDPFERLMPYTRARLADDPHIPATTLYDELTALGGGPLLPELAQDAPGPRAAAGLPPLCHGVGPSHDRHRPPARGADPVGGGPSCPRRRGWPRAGWRTCWSGWGPIRPKPGRCSPRRRTSPIWSKRWTVSSAASAG